MKSNLPIHPFTHSPIRLFVKILTIIFILFISDNSYAQKNKRDVIQFSGVVVSADSLKPMPFTNIIIKDSWRGTTTDYYGFFSFAAYENDTVIFSAIGYKKSEFKIPDTLSENKYSLIHVMTVDTILLKETVIYPWPTIEQFKQAFVNLEIPDDDLERAKKNLAQAEMKERFENYKMNASMNYRNYINNQTSKLYYAGQFPPNNLLNPIAWAKFIKAWREGKFKKKK